MADVKFLYGPKANFDAMLTKDNDTLYFLTDTLQIYKGATEYTKSCKLVRTLPESSQVQGIIYFRLTDFTAHVYNGTEFVQLNKANVTTIPTSGATDDDVPTTKAVADYVNARITDVKGEEGLFVTDVTYKDGVLSVSKNGEPVPTTLTGVVHTPTYEAENRVIRMPVFGGDELVINLGRDLVVKSGKYNAEKQTIELTLTSDDVVSIPVGSLIDIYTGVATATSSVSVSADNKISVNVKVSAKANNNVVIEEDGLYVADPDAYTKAQTDEFIKNVRDALSEHTNNTDIHVTTDQKAVWDAKVSTDELASAKTEVLTTAAADATTKANNALTSAKAYADGLNTAMDGRVTNIESSITWKTIDKQ